MTKHDDDAAERAEKRVGAVDDLAARYRELAEELETYAIANARLRYELAQAQERLELNRALEEENAGLILELNRARELIAYYDQLCNRNFGFVPVAPPGAILADE